MGEKCRPTGEQSHQHQWLCKCTLPAKSQGFCSDTNLPAGGLPWHMVFVSRVVVRRVCFLRASLVKLQVLIDHSSHYLCTAPEVGNEMA